MCGELPVNDYDHHGTSRLEHNDHSSAIYDDDCSPVNHDDDHGPRWQSRNGPCDGE